MEIKNISQKIFRSAPNKIENSANHTNPFGVNFKGNLIKADVFVKPVEKTEIVQNVAKKGKIWASAIIGSMNSVNESICRRLNSVVEFGNRIKSNVSGLWNQANNIEIHLMPDMKNIISNAKERISDLNNYSVRNLSRQGVSSLDEMLQSAIAVRVGA